MGRKGCHRDVADKNVGEVGGAEEDGEVEQKDVMWGRRGWQKD